LNLNNLVADRTGRASKSGGRNMKDSLAMLLKTNVEKMSVIGSLAILMKTSELYFISRDVDEKKGCY
jgi:hypothetical protein